VPAIAAAIADGVADLTPGPEGSASALRQSSSVSLVRFVSFFSDYETPNIGLSLESDFNVGLDWNWTVRPAQTIV
jgi:hypothetical protein